jgi:hypothetical protein
MNDANILQTPRDCQSLYSCWKFTLLFGWSGDFGPTMQQGLDSQWVFYYLYDLAIRFVLLNVVRGITVDTFSELRELKIERLRDTKETCFICGIDKQVFDRDKLSRGFAVHIKEEHNLWNYIFFIIYLWEQDKDDDDGLEHYVRRCVVANDITWMPSQISLCLSSESNGQSERDGISTTTQGILQTDLSHLQMSFHSKMNSLQQELQGALLELKTDLESHQIVNHHDLLQRRDLVSLHPPSQSRDVIQKASSLSSIEEIHRPSTTPHLSLYPPHNRTLSILKKANTLTDLISQSKKSSPPLTLTLEIQQILGLQYPSRVLDTIQCVVRLSNETVLLQQKTVSFDETTLTARPGSSNGTTSKRPIITFDPLTIILTKNYQKSNSHSQVLIQITHGAHGQHPMRYIGGVSLTYEELVLHTQQQQQQQQQRHQQQQPQQLQKYFRGEIRNQICRGTLILSTQLKEGVS